MISKVLPGMEAARSQLDLPKRTTAFHQWSLQKNEAPDLWTLTYSREVYVGTALKQLMRKWLNIVSSLHRCRKNCPDFFGGRMSVKPNHHVGSSVQGAITISLLHQKSKEILLKKEPEYQFWMLYCLSHMTTTNKNLKFEQLIESKGPCPDHVTSFLDRNYEVLSMWFNYEATIVTHSKMNSHFVFTFECRWKCQHGDHIFTFESLCYNISVHRHLHKWWS